MSQCNMSHVLSVINVRVFRYSRITQEDMIPVKTLEYVYIALEYYTRVLHLNIALGYCTL